MFNRGKYKTLIGNLTVFKNMYETDVIRKKGTVIDIDKVEEDPKGKVRGFFKDGSYIIMRSYTGTITVEAVKTPKKGGTK